MTDPLVSIVIPLYNKEPWVLQSLETVINQTYQNWEIILVNDGSTDNSLRIVNEFVGQNRSNWKIITIANSGQCTARNLGISQAKGKYVAFLDPDDLWQYNKLEVQVHILENSPDIVATLCPYLIFSDSRGKSLRLVNHKSSSSLLRNWLRMTGYGGGTESTGLVRREALNQVGGFNELLSTSAGLLLTLELSKLGQINITNGTFMAYRIYTGQWHGNTHQLQQDVETIRDLLAQKGFIVPRKLKNWHNAYFRINEFRNNEEKFRDFCRILFSEPDKFFRLAMITCLIWRNFQARIRSIRFYRCANQSRNEMDSFLFPKDVK